MPEAHVLYSAATLILEEVGTQNSQALEGSGASQYCMRLQKPAKSDNNTSAAQVTPDSRKLTLSGSDLSKGRAGGRLEYWHWALVGILEQVLAPSKLWPSACGQLNAGGEDVVGKVLLEWQILMRYITGSSHPQEEVRLANPQCGRSF